LIATPCTRTPGLPASALIEASNYLNHRLKGRTLAELKADVGANRQAMEREISEITARLVESGLAATASDAGDMRLIVRGQANLLEDLTALSDLERMRLLFADLEREKEVIVQSPLMPLPAVLQERLIEGNLLPKERWLASFCQSEKAQRRRVLVYVRQTGTRDIQERIETVLKNAGLQVITLYSGVDPRKREAWIDTHADVDVLITNPRLVATGLDLVNFASVVFAEVEYSLYVLWQALRRVWRLGQTKPVKAVFSVYRGTMEAQALALMGRKMRAAQLLYGDNVGGAIVPVEDGDFITELAREVLRGTQLDDLQSLFADEMQMSNSPMGCPTEISPILVPVQPRTWDEWLNQRDLAGRIPTTRRSVRRSNVEAPGQLSIWSSMKEK
jgi:SNF2 family DNA or RNA helicase